jgi:hypothetical protein
MKNTSTLVLCTIFSCITILSQAQDKSIPLNEPNLNKPKLFQNLPEKITVEVSSLESLFTIELGHSVNTKLGSFQLLGDVLSKSSANDIGTQNNTVIVNLSNYPGANLTLSKINNSDGTIGYTGRIISFQHGDLFELQNQNGSWVLVKRNFYDLINE